MAQAGGYAALADILLALEMQLRAHGLWEQNPPSPQALASTAPFCIDTLGFHQWLQFIFIPRIKAIIESGAPLPHASGLVPIAEEFFRGTSDQGQSIIQVLQAFDDFIAQAAQ